MKLLPYFIVIGIAAALGSCKALSPSGSTTSYSEDLSANRPKIETDTTAQVEQTETRAYVTPQYHQTSEVDTKLQEITSFNRTSNSAQGFTIQVYSGTSREEASQAKAQVYKILPDSRPQTRYEQPIYRVHVGEFIDRLEAQNTYAKLRVEFPQAIVIPTRIVIN